MTKFNENPQNVKTPQNVSGYVPDYEQYI